MPAPLLAAPLVIPFAEAIGLSVAVLGMAKIGDEVNKYIEKYPDESIKILSTIVPNIGIGQIFANKKDSDEEVSEDIDVEVEEKPKKLSGKEKGMRIKEAIRRARAGKGNYSSPDAEGSAVDIRGSVIREVEDMGIADKDLKDNYDPDKPKFDYEKFFKRRRRADGGAIGIEVLFEEKKDGGRAGSTMKPKRGLVNEPGGYAGLTTQQQALLGLQLQNDPEFQTGYYKATPELEFEDFYKAPTGPLGYVDKVEGSSSYFDEDLEKYNTGPKGPLRDLDMDRTMGIINALDTKDPSGELGFNYMEKLKTTPDGGIYETMQTNTPKFAEFQKTPNDQITKSLTPTNFKNLSSTNREDIYGYTTLPGILPSEYGTKFQTETNPVYVAKDLADFITTKPMSPANQLPLYSDEAAQLGFYGAKPADLMNQAIDTIQHEYTHNITKFPEFAGVMKNTMDAGVPSTLQLKGKPGDGISKFDKEELFTRAIDIERRFNKDGNLNSPNVENDIAYMNQVLNKKYRNLNKDGQSMAIQYINSIQPQVQDYFNVINQQAQKQLNQARINRAYREDTGGKGGSYTTGESGVQSDGSYNDPFDPGGGEKDGGIIGYQNGGRVGLFMGGPALEGQALNIYNSMNAYGFDDQAIANALTEQGLYTAPGSGTPETPPTTIQPVGLQTGSDNFSPYNPDPNSIKTVKQDPAIQANLEAIQRNQQLQSMGIQDPFAKEMNPANAYYGDMFEDTSNLTGKQSMFAKAKQGLVGLMDNPLVNLISSSTPFGMIKNVAKGIGSKMPVNQRAIQENIMGNMGFAVNDIGQIVSTGDYNDPNNVMAGYNLYRMTPKTFMKRINMINKNLKLGKYQNEDAMKKRLAAIEEAKRQFEAAEKLKRLAVEEARLKKGKAPGGGTWDGGGGPAYTGPGGVGGGEFKDSMGNTDYQDAYDPGGGEKDGGIIGYREGGLVTMFKEKR